MGRSKDGADQSAAHNGPVLNGGEEKDMSVSQRRGLLLENLALIPIFTGQDPNFHFADFSQKFKSFADFLEWPKDDRLFAIQQRLAGPALQTFSNFRDQIKDIDSFFKVLGDVYNKEKDPSALLEDFWNFKQAAGIPVPQYLAISKQKAKNAVSAQNLPVASQKQTEEQWLLAMLKKNLEPQIRKGVIARNPTSLEELEKIAILEEKAWLAVQAPLVSVEKYGEMSCAISEKSHSKKEIKNNISEEIRNLKEIISSLSEKVEKLSKNNSRPDKSHIICHFCGLSGHYQSHCFRKNATTQVNNQGGSNNRGASSVRNGGRRANFRPYGQRPFRNRRHSEENKSEESENSNSVNIQQTTTSENAQSSASGSLNGVGSL